MNHSDAHKTPPALNLYGFSITGQRRPRDGLQKIRLLITITAHMNGTHTEKKVGGDKIALLGLFVGSLLIARILVVSKSVILLSEPVRLPHAGLAVSMPAGNGWLSEEQWTYKDDIFTLNSFFMVDRERPRAWARCLYHLQAQQTAPERRFESQAYMVGGFVVEAGQMRAGSVTIDWARIDIPETLFCVVLGTARLPDDRQLDIEVYQTIGNAEMAGRVFKRIADSLQFMDSQIPNQDVI